MLSAMDAVKRKEQEGARATRPGMPTATLAVWALGLSLLASQTHHAEDMATVRGTVMDMSGARVRAASVEFVGRGGNNAVRTADDGSYTINLEPGAYEVTAHLTGFCPRHRGTIVLPKNSQTEIDLEMLVGGYGDPIEIDPIPTESSNQTKTRCLHENGYNEEQLTAVAKTGLHPLVLYARRQEKPDSILYFGSQADNKRLPAVFTYNLATLRADSIVYHLKDDSIDGLGGVVWQDGKQTWHGSRVKLSLDGQFPKAIVKE